MKDKDKKKSLLHWLNHFSWFLVFLWTGFVSASLLWNLHEQRVKIHEIALNNAHLTYERDLIYRKWAAKQGGVYVPVSEHTPPNPYLSVPNQDITTSSGLALTLVNPAYMSRQVNQMAADLFAGRIHLTSLKPIRPENRPDSWETAALKSFERGMKEASSVEKIAGQDHLRLMHPFLTEKECLKCHASQGYKEGDIRGGISISIPMGPLYAIENPLITRISLAHLLLWLVGFTGIVLSKKRLNKQILARETAEAELSKSAKKLRTVADFTYDWEYWRSPDDRFLYISPSCERITGYTREEFMQDPALFSRIIHPDDRELMAAHLRKDRQKSEQCELKFRIVRRDGQERWIGHSCQSVLDVKGEFLGRRASNRDITGRKEVEESLRESEERFSKAFHVGPAAIFISRLADGCFFEVNESFLRLSGYDSEDVIGHTSTELNLFVNPDERAGIFRSLDEQGSIQDYEMTARTKTGRLIQVLFSSQRITLKGQDCLVSTLIDITERRRAEEALRQHALELQSLTETLEERVLQRTGELANLSAELVSAQEDERKRISYDLHDHVWQTLLAIRFEIEHLFSKPEKADWASLDIKSKDIMADILTIVKKIRSMQGDLWPYVLDDIGISATIDWYCREFETMHPDIAVERQIELTEAEVPAKVKIVIYRIMQETMTNAAQYSRGNHMALSLKIDDRITFTIKDNGIGFDPAETMTPKTPWEGVGLLSLKARTELSGGTFQVESVKEKGTTVRASWPFDL